MTPTAGLGPPYNGNGVHGCVHTVNRLRYDRPVGVDELMKTGWRVREMSIEKEHAQLIDSGAYECRVSNTNGLITAKFDVQVTPSGASDLC